MKPLTIISIKSIEGGYTGFIKELPGCMTQAETKEELVDNILDALIAACKKDKDFFKLEEYDSLEIFKQGPVV